MSYHTQKILPAALALLAALLIAAKGDDKVEVEISESLDFQAGLKVGAGRRAWISGAEHRMYLNLLENGREDELKDLFETGMWLSILELDDFVRNEKADTEEKEAAQRILGKLVDHFLKNPKKIEKPKGSDLTAPVEEGVQKKIEKGKVDGDVKPILEEIAAAAHEPLQELEGVFDSFLLEGYQRDLKIQKVFDRLAKAEQNGADQPATVLETKPKVHKEPKLDSEERSQ